MWQQAIPDEDLQFNNTVIVLQNHHNPLGRLSLDMSNSLQGMGQMMIAVETYYLILFKDNPLANFSSWCLATQRFQANMYKSEILFYQCSSRHPEQQLGSLWQLPTWAGIEYNSW
jgi:beta-mannosidase